NTVRHRLRRIEQYTGRDLANPQDAAEIAVALQAVRLFPDLLPAAE
ncbi:MAG TPA: helix-turn-helix domain-containing protein, partial [Mycobacterium sp.]|nr:helix-turn-helix domain-containing protein [Mycobacterium sp.]